MKKKPVKENITPVHNKLSILLLVSLISGCTVTKNYQPPPVEVPSGWRVSHGIALNLNEDKDPTKISEKNASILADTAWWEKFNDTTLNNLITTALNKNKDLRIAIANVEKFTWRTQVAKSGYYPQVGYTGGAYRDQSSLNRARPLFLREDRINDNYEGAVGVNWELDLWGRIKRANEVARADLLSAEEGKRAVILTLVSTLAQSYIDLLRLDSQLEISKRTLAVRLEWVKLFEKKSEGGQVSDLELAQVRSAYQEVAVDIKPLELRIAQQENFISVLLGDNPKTIDRKKILEELKMPEVPQGLPSDLLKRRPDILQEEQNLIAENAKIGIVQTQYYPRISLTGLLGYASKELSNFITGSSNFWSYGAGLAGPLYTGGRIKGEVFMAKAQYEQSVNQYLKTILNAFREVNDSLIALKKLKEEQEEEKKHLTILTDYINFAQSRFETGYTEYLTVLDSQRQLYRAEMNYAQTQSQSFIALVNLYKVMGGGWVTKAEELIEKPSEMKETIVKKTH